MFPPARTRVATNQAAGQDRAAALEAPRRRRPSRLAGRNGRPTNYATNQIPARRPRKPRGAYSRRAFDARHAWAPRHMKSLAALIAPCPLYHRRCGSSGSFAVLEGLCRRSTPPDLLWAGPPPAGRPPWIRNIPTWSDAEPAVAADIAVVLHHFTNDRGAAQRAAATNASTRSRQTGGGRQIVQ